MTGPPDNDSTPRAGEVGGAGPSDQIGRQDSPNLTEALRLASLGWPVFPCHTPVFGAPGTAPGCSCGNPACKNIGKHPRTERGLKDATTETAVITGWWARWPDANVAVRTGAESGIVAIDIDPRHGGDVTLGELEARHGKLPATVEALTGGGGRHILFQHPGVHVKGRNVLPGIDVKGDGGYIVAEPSLHASGKRYTWELSGCPGEVPLAPVPPWLFVLIMSRPNVGGSEPPPHDEAGETIPEGARNGTLTSLAGSMRKRGMSHDAIFAALRAENTTRCKPPLDDAEVEKIARSISRYQPAPRPEAVVVGPARLWCKGLDDRRRLIVSACTEDGTEVALDYVDRSSSWSRKRFAKSVAEEAGLDEEQAREIEAALRSLQPLPEPEPAEEREVPPREELLAEMDARRRERLDATPADVVAEAEALLWAADLIDRLDRDIGAIGVVGEEVLGMTLYMQGVSRLLDDPLSIITQGISSSGKSYIIAQVARLFPEEAVVGATDITPQALYYTGPGALMHRWVVAGEQSRSDNPERLEGRRTLREMISAGELSKLIPLKTPQGGFQTVRLVVNGPIAFIESTTNTRLFDEDANRCLLISTDETPEQTARVVKAIAGAAARGKPDLSRLVQVHHTMQRLLRRARVRVPFADALATAMPTQRPEARRAITQVLAVVRAVALLHQRQRCPGGVKDGDTIEAAIHDYVVARRLLMEPLDRSLGGSLTPAVSRFAERLDKRYETAVFTSTRAMKDDEALKNKGKVNQYLRTLADAGLTECVKDSRGAEPAEWKMIRPPEPGADWLPTVDQITGGGS